MILYNIYFSLSDLLYPVWQPLGPSTSLHMILFRSFLWLSNSLYPGDYSCLENPMDRGAWWATVHGVMKSWIWLSDFTFTFPFHALEKEMASHSSVLAWRIPGTGEPGGLPSTGWHRVRHDWSDLAAIVYIHSSVDGHLGCFHVLAIVNSTVLTLSACILLNSDFLQIPA